jgi:hypothetical protein
MIVSAALANKNLEENLTFEKKFFFFSTGCPKTTWGKHARHAGIYDQEISRPMPTKKATLRKRLLRLLFMDFLETMSKLVAKFSLIFFLSVKVIICISILLKIPYFFIVEDAFGNFLRRDYILRSLKLSSLI